MNIALEQTEEHVNGTVTNRYGDAFIRGNNGASLSRSYYVVCFISFLVLYISAAEALWFTVTKRFEIWAKFEQTGFRLRSRLRYIHHICEVSCEHDPLKCQNMFWNARTLLHYEDLYVAHVKGRPSI